jgi:cation transport ATPase
MGDAALRKDSSIEATSEARPTGLSLTDIQASQSGDHQRDAEPRSSVSAPAADRSYPSFSQFSGFKRGVVFVTAATWVLATGLLVLDWSASQSAAARELLQVLSLPAAVLVRLLAVVLLVPAAESSLRRGLRDLCNAMPSWRALAGLSLLALGFACIVEPLENLNQLSSVSLAFSLLGVLLLLACLERLAQRAKSVLSESLESVLLDPEQLVLAVDQSPQLLPARALKPGAQFKIGSPGYERLSRKIPFDCEVLKGVALVRDYRRGQRDCMLRKQGQEIAAGADVVRGELHLRVVNPCGDGDAEPFYQKLLRNFSLIDEQGKGQKQVRAILGWMTIFIAACAAVFWHERGASISQILSTVSAVLALGSVLFLTEFFLQSVRLLVAQAFERGLVLSSPEVLNSVAQVTSFSIDADQDEQQLWAIESIEFMDDRFGKAGLESLAFALASLGETQSFCAVRSALAASCAELELIDYKGGEVFEGRGAYAQIQGLECSLGDEDFLLQRGVCFQANDVLGAESPTWYLAIQEDVVMRIRFNRGISASLGKDLREVGLQPTVLAQEGGVELDARGKRWGFELSEIYGGLSSEQFAEKVSRPGCLFVASLTSDELCIQRAYLCVGPFDRLRYDFERFGITLLSLNLDALHWLLSSTQQLLPRLFWLRVLALVAVGALFPPAFLGLLTTDAVLLVSVLLAGLASLLVLQPAERDSA